MCHVSNILLFNQHEWTCFYSPRQQLSEQCAEDGGGGGGADAPLHRAGPPRRLPPPGSQDLHPVQAAGPETGDHIPKLT